MAGELLVDPPRSVEDEHGLLRSAQQLVQDAQGDLEASRWTLNGLQFLPMPCAPPRGFAPGCDPATDDMVVEQTFGDLVTVRPVTVYGTDYCTLPLVVSAGVDPADRARYRVVLGLSAALEAELERGVLAGSQEVTLVNSPTVLSATAVDMTTAMGLLEDALGSGLGTIHVPTIAGPLIVQNGLVRTDGNRLRTATKGHTVVLGNGYQGHGPATGADADGPTPTAGTAWLYATGPIVVRLAPLQVWDPATTEAGREHRTNTATGTVMQTALVYHDNCRKFAVPVNVPGAATPLPGEPGVGLGTTAWLGTGSSRTVGPTSGSFVAVP